MHKHKTRSLFDTIQFDVLSELKREVKMISQFQDFSIFYLLCHLSVTKGMAQLEYSPGHGPQAILPPRSLPLRLPECCSLGKATTSGRGKLLSLRHPLETPARRRKAPFCRAAGSSLQPSRQDTQRWGRDENTMWRGGV